MALLPRLLKYKRIYWGVFSVVVLVASTAFFVNRVRIATEFERSKAEGPPPVVSEKLKEKMKTAGESEMVSVMVKVVTPIPFGDKSREITQAEVGQVEGYVSSKEDQISALLPPGSFNVKKTYKYSPYINLEVNKAALAILESSRGVVEFIEEDQVLTPQLQPSGGLPAVGQIIGSTILNTGNLNGTGYSVAVVDTGVDYNHPFLSGQIVGGRCFGYCPAGAEGLIAARPCERTNWSDTNDAACEHGTSISGVIAGKPLTYAGQPIQGVAPGAKILPVRVTRRTCTNESDPNTCSFRIEASEFLSAVEWVYEQRNTYNIAALNLSVSVDGTLSNSICDGASIYTEIFRLLTEAGVGVVAATGNYTVVGQLPQHACVSYVIPVSNTYKDDRVFPVGDRATGFPNFMLAPGVDIITSARDSGFGPKTGTSYAAPVVSAAFAIMKQAYPGATVAQIVQALKTTGVPIYDDPTSPAPGIPGGTGATFPRVQVDRAVGALLTQEIANQTTAQYGVSGTQSTWNHSTGGTLGASTKNSKVLQASTYQNMALVTAAYRAEINTTAQVTSATYCGQPLQRVGSRVKFQHQTIEMWYGMNPPNPPAGQSSCPVVVNFSAEPQNRALTATLFNNVDSVAPIHSTNTGGVGYPPGSLSFQMSSVGPRDSIYVCTYSNYPSANVITPQTNSTWRQFFISSSANDFLVQTGLASSIQRRSDNELMTMSWLGQVAYPWASVCANFRVKPFAPAPTVPPFTPPPTPTPVPTLAPTPTPTQTPIPTTTPTATPGSITTGWRADYYPNTSFSATGSLATQVLPDVNLNWAAGSPGSPVPIDNFAARFRGTLRAPTTGTFSFRLESDNWAGLFVNGTRIVAGTGTQTVNYNLVAGQSYVMKIDYLEYTGNAAVRLYWRTPGSSNYVVVPQSLMGSIPNSLFTNPTVISATGTPQPTPTSTPTPVPTPTATTSSSSGFGVMYFPNTSFTGGLTGANTPTVNFDWVAGGPGAPITGRVDNFSARFAGKLRAPATGNYTFQTVADNWAGIVLNGVTRVTGTGTRTFTISLTQNQLYNLKIDYLEQTGNASIRLNWLTPGSSTYVPIPASVMTPVSFSNNNPVF